MLAFNIGNSESLGILPQLPITLGVKIIYINVMVVQVPLDFNLLLGSDYVYITGALFSSLFCVMCFPHEGRIITIDKLSFVSPNLTPNKPTSLNGPFVQVVSPPLKINYVATFSMPSSIDDIIGDVAHNLLGELEFDLSIRSIDPIQSIVIPSNDY